VVEVLLPVLDDFERALGVDCADKEYVAGLELIFQRLYAELQKLGLEPVEALDQKFDPNLHHAIEKVESAEAAEDIVVSVFQKGYRFRGKLLRPAIVKVGTKA
jgi:molecular chaperone GrpE